MSAFVFGATLAGIGGIMGYGAAKDQQRALEKSAGMSFDMATRDVAQTEKDLQAQRVKDARALLLRLWAATFLPCDQSAMNGL